MGNGLIERFGATRRRLSRILMLHGAAALLLGVVAVATGAGLVDWLLHVSSGMRLLFLALLVTVSGWLTWRRLVRPLTVSVRDLDLALRLERAHPELSERLSSTVDFLRCADADPFAGSKQLRERVIEDASIAARDLDFDAVVESRPARRMVGLAVGVLGAAAALCIANPSDAAIALRRLANPFGSTSWPLLTGVEIVSAPERVAKGDPFPLTVKVSGVIPSRVVVRYRFDAVEEPAPEPLRLGAEDLYRGGLEAANRPFSFAVTAGDARTEWRPVDVVPAPQVTTLQLTLAYPTYTGLADETYAEGRGHVRAVVGAEVSLAARANKPLERAELLWESGGSTPAIVAEDGESIHARFDVRQNDDYRIVLHDRQSMTNSQRSPKKYRVQAVQDAAPEVSIQEPTGDREVTRQATIPIKTLVKDDFGIDEVKLVYAVRKSGVAASAETPEAEQSLFRHAEAAPSRQVTEYAWSLAGLDLTHGSVVRFFATASDLRDPPAPNVGKSREIQLRVVTEEEFLRQVENRQRLVRERLQRILKLQEHAHELVTDLEKQAEIVGRLDRPEVDKLQSAELIQRRIGEDMVDSNQSLTKEIGSLLRSLDDNRVEDPTARKSLRMIRSELARLSEQHLPPISQSLTQARKRTAGVRDSAPPRTEGDDRGAARPTGAEPENPAPGDDARDGAESAEVAPSKPGAADPKDARPKQSAPKDPAAQPTDKPTDKPPVAKTGAVAKTKARKRPDAPAESPSKRADGLAGNLREAGGHQKEVVDSLAQMIEQLDEWDTVAQVANDARDLRRRQSEVARQVEKLARETLGKQLPEKPRQGDAEDNPSFLDARERAELAKSASRQEENREQVQRLQRKMGRLAERTAKEDAATAELLRDALEQSRKANVAGQMQDAARSIRGNQLGAASKRQRDIGKAIEQLIESLENRREQELVRLVKQLEIAEKDLEAMLERQQRLLRKTKEAEDIQDPQERERELKRLRKRQQELRRETEQFARRLSRLRARTASRRSGRAASRMDQAGRRLEQGGQEQARERQKEALDELQEAQEELAKARQQAEVELAQERLAKISDSIRQIHQREVGVKEEIGRLNESKGTKGRWTRGQIQSVSALSRTQRGLSDEAKGIIDKLAGVKVFVLVVEQAVEDMQRAAELLRQRRTDLETERNVDSAIRRFAQLLDSLRSDGGAQGKGKKGQQQGQGGGGGGAGDGIPNIAQVKLLKALQQEINSETERLVALRGGVEKPDEELERRFESLSRRQGRLADLVRELSRPVADEEQEGAPQ